MHNAYKNTSLTVLPCTVYSGMTICAGSEETDSCEVRFFSYNESKGKVVIHFYGTEIVIWAGFGPVGCSENKIGPIMSNFGGCFHWRYFFFF